MHTVAPASTQRNRTHWVGVVTDHWPLLLLTALYPLLFAVISPRYEVPQMDDWAYFLHVQQWFATGHIPYLSWADPTLLFQVIWGGAFARLLGLTYTSVRLSTLVLAWAGVLSMYGILRTLGVGRTISFVGAALLFFHPIYMGLSYSFNTDVPYVALATVSTFLFLDAIAKDRVIRFLFAGIVGGLAFLVRQPGIIIPFVVTVYLFLNRNRSKVTWGKVAATLAPGLLAVVIYSLWFYHLTGGFWLDRISNLHHSLRGVSRAQGHGILSGALMEGSASVLTLGIVTVPLAVAVIGSLRSRFRTRPGLIYILAGTAQLMTFASWALINEQPGRLWSTKGWPYQPGGGYLTRFGAFPLNEPAPAIAPTWVWSVLTYLAPILAGLVITAAIRVFLDAKSEERSRRAALVLAAGLMQFLPLMALDSIYDRYGLVLLPAGIVAGASWIVARKRDLVVCVLVLAAFATASTEWTREYIDRAKACWQVSDALVKQGASPAEITGTWEWEGAHLYLEAIRTLHIKAPFDFEKTVPWGPLLRPRYYVSLLEVRGQTPLSTATYRPFFRRGRASVFTYPFKPGS